MNKEIIKKFEGYIKDSPPKHYFDTSYGGLDDSVIKEMYESDDPRQFIDEYIWESYSEEDDGLCDYYISHFLEEHFPDEELTDDEREELFLMASECVVYPIEDIMRITQVPAHYMFYSNYDGVGAGNRTVDEDEYLKQIYAFTGIAISSINREAFEVLYSGSLLSILGLFTLEEYLNEYESDTFTIPKGSHFGFIEAGFGSCSPYDGVTDKSMSLNKKLGDTEYDEIILIPDCTLHYSLNDIMGVGDDFFETI